LLVPGEKIKVIPNPVDLAYILSLTQEEITDRWFLEDVPMLISAGRLVKQKNFACLLHAFRLVADQNPGVRLTILGKGELEEELLKLIKRLNLEKRVRICHSANPFKYMKKADIFVLSSLWEGYPNVLLEAFACGTPLISADCPSGPREIIENDKDGILVTPNNPEALARAIKRLLDDENMRTSFGLAGSDKVSEKHGLQVIVPQYTDFLFGIFYKKKVYSHVL